MDMQETKMNSRRLTKSGFTLVELTFAIAFLSVLMLTITMVTNEITTLYHKGYVLKTVNQVGRSLIEEFSSAVTDSPPASIKSFCNKYTGPYKTSCINDNGYASVYHRYYYSGNIKINGEDKSGPFPVGGVFCTNGYSYIWNTGYVLSDNYADASGNSIKKEGIVIKYTTLSNPTQQSLKDFRLVKFPDAKRSACDFGISANYPSTVEMDIASLSSDASADRHIIELSDLTEAPVEILSESDTQLVLYDFQVFPPAQVEYTSHLLYSASFILGTKNGGINVMTNNNFCQITDTSGYSSVDFSYCAVNKFNFSVQASS
ncbi:prepilin-type N-terminal cleavage/methylation domain-containing protein [Candidatus Saccharibacteria bacterium]|nr:prepilin-type N-terminal cleavage/methylation domain-containing protein [Candidatus Saccharibacteria bacterium]